MKGLVKSLLHRLFDRQSAISTVEPKPTSPTNATVTLPHASNNVAPLSAADCERVLNYWLDTELFDLPECPFDTRKGIISQPADEFKATWGQTAIEQIAAQQIPITDKSRLLIMFQCHRAGYLARDHEKHPNYIVPRTYLVAQAMIPQWDLTEKTLTWLRSDEDEDITLNLATMRTLYRRCRSSVPAHMSLPQWVEARIASIETKLHSHLGGPDSPPLSSEELQTRIIEINRELADEFWPDEQARDYMLQHCQPLESGYMAEQDKPHQLSSGAITFRWRFCYYPDEIESKQLGPFFVKDLEHAINLLSSNGFDGLSQPLSHYLAGQPEQVKVTAAVNQGDFFVPHTRALLPGRWPENPRYGLSLLQAFAVNVARHSDHPPPIVAVNGPPGTGKTTLLKDIIADHFVARTHALSQVCDQPDWFSNATHLNVIMQHSLLVASSNNKAVENISKELPALGQLDELFAQQTTHFRHLAPDSDWGLFCAVLGNSSNRNAFKALLKKVSDHIKFINDRYKLNLFYSELQKAGAQKAPQIVTQFVRQWQERNQLLDLTSDIQLCPAYQKYNTFFVAFTDHLQQIEAHKLTLESFASSFTDLDETQWEESLAALDAFKRQWFAKKLYQPHSDKKLNTAKQDFLSRYQVFNDPQAESAAFWEMHPEQNLISARSYAPNPDESPEAAEQRLQMSSPFASEKLNRHRSEMFASALRLNEALLEHSSTQFSAHWENLNQLIDGRLETNETVPHHQQLWALLFLFFPVISSSLSSIENQFKLMQKTGGFGLAMIDEAGQAVNYHVVGLLQRCRQAIFVGDPIQLEPVVTLPPSLDRAIARDFIAVSAQDGVQEWGDPYLVSASSAQSLADRAGRFMAQIGERNVGIPLLVHRRCTNPMFSIANKIAYDNTMVMASQSFSWPALPSGWIHVEESPASISKPGYSNTAEATTALKIVEFLVKSHPNMVAGGVYVITPFSKMRTELQTHAEKLLRQPEHQLWMQQALGTERAATAEAKHFVHENIGTVHTFQGKEASTVILCLAASSVRKNTGGISWVNSKPNLLNVAVTRAKHHLFVVGNYTDWAQGPLSYELQTTGMQYFDSVEKLIQQ